MTPTPELLPGSSAPAKTSLLLRSLRGILHNAVFRLRHRTTRNYWETRHGRFSGDLAAVGHLELSDKENLIDYDTKKEQLDRVLRRHLPARHASPQLALDIGCGTGQLFPVLRAHGCSITGLDFSQRALEVARTRFPAAFLVVGDSSSIVLRRKFGLITAIDVMFHILDDRLWFKALQNMAAHLEPGGVLVIQEHFVDEASYRGIESHCHFRRSKDYFAVLKALNLGLREALRYQLPSEGTHKDMLVLSHKGPLEGTQDV